MLRVVVPLVLLLCFAASGNALEFAYYTSVRNDSKETIDITPDMVDEAGRHHTVKPGKTVIFLGGFSTVRFVVRTPKHPFEYKFPFSFGVDPTHCRGRQRHSYVFTGEHTIYPLDPAGAIVHHAPGFPLIPRSP